MADETPAPGNGNVALKRDLAVAWILGGVVCALVGVVGFSMFWKAEQWDLTTKVVDGLLVLANMLAGGLLVKTKSG